MMKEPEAGLVAHLVAFAERPEVPSAAAHLMRSAAEAIEHREDVLSSLNYVVQYRRKDQTKPFDPWHTMAAFDVEGPAQRYCEQQSSDTWEYRWLEIERDTRS